ncbi:hypothetical protein K469DRAFT_587577 [Zopfia rhizophila CBS 207.26]|uniref:F-box domain-containing protein n=1 Tax=Zopfia rhizophila CBS 207.26 TaxID=1314779 RepID=A0A6A6DUB8_9PEZI|nr:hypothetical protein K469DRAFT_587577 [Zopfia rhizophila CBS 207.26]
MPVTLDRLPFDILFYIASSLQFDDIIHLGHTCRQLRLLLNESTLCRRAIEGHVPHSKEAKLAQGGAITYGEALQSVYDRREAFSNAYPFSARIAGHGSAFTYRQGVLCILHGNIIRFSDVHSSSGFSELDLSTIISSLPVSPSGSSNNEPKISLLHYSDDIIAVHYERKGRPNNSRILAISTREHPPKGKRVIKDIPLESSYKLFSRHTASYLYYGTYTGMGDHGHHEWEIQGVSLDEAHSLSKRSRPLQLEEFFGTDIGSTIAFEIHNGYFYALSNQTSFDVEELDWTSFYHCIRFPLERPVSEALDINTRIYRRQHSEGPIHDSWTDLTLQVDECTNKLVIVESRREWQNGSSRQLRTFYTSEIKFAPEGSSSTPSDDRSPAAGAADAPLLPADDLLTTLVDSSNNPHYAPPQPRYARHTHPEFGPQGGNTRSFILARTKFRAYNFSCSSFIDLVEDERCCANPSNPLAGPCLRLRIGSRRPAPRVPEEWSMHDKVTLAREQSISAPLLEGDESYRYSQIKMWPPPASTCPCSEKLHRILNPKLPSGFSHNKTITGVVDERSFVYMIRPGKSYSGGDDNALGTIVVVSFNREKRIPNSQMSRIDSTTCFQDEMEDQVSQSHWMWKAGQFAACRKRTCR